METKLVERWSGDIHYYVDITTPSNIFLDKNSYEKIANTDCDLSVLAISQYIRENNSSYSPVLLTWEMTSRCNFNCPFCYIKDNQLEKEIVFEEVIETIDLLVSEGLFEAYLSGGECLLIDDFLKIYRYIKEKGVFITVFTNGSLINETVLECWKEFPPNSVEITVYNNNFQSKPFQNILKLHEMGIYVLVKFTLTNITAPYYDSVKEWVKINQLPFNVDASIYDGIDELHAGIKDKYALSNEQRKLYFSTVKTKYDGEKVIRTALSCKSRKGIIQIAPDFTMSLCNKMKTRWNLRNTDPKVALYELRKLIAVYENKVLHGCSGCSYSRNCSMCVVSAEVVDGEFYVPKGYCESICKMSLEE